MGLLVTIATFALVFGLLVFFHELGHFLAAKSFRMKVEEFAFGFFWPLLKVRVGETQYTIRAVPLGGFVRIAGMEVEDEVEGHLTGAESSHYESPEPDVIESAVPASPLTEDIRPASEVMPPDHPDRFNNRPPYQRYLVYLAGPVFSFLFGWLTLCLIGAITGIPDKSTLAVAEISKGSIAEQSGLKVGEVIVSMDGKTVESFDGALEQIHSSVDVPISFGIKDKTGTIRTLVMTPKGEKTPKGDTIGRIGFVPRQVTITTKQQGLVESFVNGTRLTQVWWMGMFTMFKERNIAENVGGPVAIFRETKAASEMGFPYLMSLFGQLSLSLGFFNLLPIPVLDGGHMLMIVIEMIRRKKLSARQTHNVLLAGLAVMALLFVLVLVKDISGFFTRG